MPASSARHLSRHPIDPGLDPALSMAGDQVALLTRSQREQRAARLITESWRLLGLAKDAARWHAGEGRRLTRPRELAGVVGLFSGGNDSATLMHLMRGRMTHAAHANTGIGIEATRQYVRETCASWGLPLLERSAPLYEDSYRAMVLERGFPGPAHHYKMYARLKERALRVVRRELVTDGKRQRVIFLAGRRRDESDRRAQVPEMEREDSVVWCSPLVQWTRLDMNTYRLMRGDVPHNPVTDVLHMSGECLCGSFAKRDELEWLAKWYPGEPALALIAELEELIAGREDIAPERRKWGWGAYRDNLPELMKRARAGRLCAACASG